MQEAAEQQPDDALDPDIRRFTSEVMAASARLAAGRALSVPEMRRIAEEVRAPWCRGGPAMRRTTEQDVPTPHGPVRLRVYDPGVQSPAPALLYVHGGGWTLFSLDTHDRVMREYAERAGVVVVGIDYALSPEARYPVALEQVVAVARWLHGNAARLGIDPARIALGGDSAGGNLSLAAALALREAGEGNLVKALLLIYPVVQDGCSAESLRVHGGPGAMLTGEEMAFFWDNYVSGSQRDDPWVCPIRAELAGLPPVCLTIAEHDVLAEQCRDMAGRLAAAGVPVESTVYPGATHSFIEAVSISSLAQRAIADGAAFLAKRLA
jgi:acetyl esterase